MMSTRSMRFSTRCEPRYATPRRPSRKSLGPRLRVVGEKLGQPLMPWQQMVADVGLELTADGNPAYREVIVTIPRQNGKTTLVLVWEIDRCFGWGKRQSIAYTAQTGKDAREKLLDEQVPML